VAWEKRAIPEQQYIKSRNAAAQTAMRFDIARQKLMALGVEEGEISEIPQAPQGSQSKRPPQRDCNSNRPYAGHDCCQKSNYLAQI